MRKKLHKAQETMKQYADKNRIDHHFKVGDWILVKLRPYRQTSVAGHRVHKLSKHYYGPYKITKALWEVSFEIELPPGTKIHLVFQVSQLKPCP